MNRKQCFTQQNIIRAVAREMGFRQDELELVDLGYGSQQIEARWAALEARPGMVLRSTAQVAVREGVDCAGRTESGARTSWWVLPSADYDRKVCEECIQLYVDEGLESLEREVGEEACARALARVASPSSLRGWLRGMLVSARVRDSVVEAAMADPGEYVRLIYLDDPGEATRVLMSRGGRAWRRRLPRVLLEEVGGPDEFNDNKNLHTREGFVIEEGEEYKEGSMVVDAEVVPPAGGAAGGGDPGASG